MEISGLASGIDTQALIEATMAVERKPINLMTKKKDTYQEQLDTWRDINRRLLNLKDKIVDLQKPEIFKAKSTTSTDTGVATATADTSAVVGEYHINVTNVATSTQATSDTRMGLKVNPNVALQDGGFGTTIISGTFTINGISISVDGANESLNNIISKINSSSANVTASYDDVNDTLTLKSNAGSQMQLGSGGDTSNFLEATRVIASEQVGDTITSSGALGATDTNSVLDQARLATPLAATNTGSFKINGVEIAYDKTQESLNDIFNKINDANTGVTANYDPISDKIVLASKETGGISIGLEDVSGNFLEATGLLNTTQNLGTNAKYSINEVNGGQVLTSTSNDITGVIQGVTVTLKDTGSTVIDLTSDNDTAVEKVKDFVEQYNSTMSFINSKLAKDANLQGDSSLIRLQTSLRNDTTGLVSGLTSDTNLISEIGINGSRAGTITLDETKLKDVLKTDPDAVFNLFNSADGVGTRLYDEIDLQTKSTNGLISRTEENLNKRIEDINKSIESTEKRLEIRRKILVQKYAAMDTAIASLNSQGDWLSQQFASMSSTK